MGLCFQENDTVGCVLGRVTPEAGAMRLGAAGATMVTTLLEAADQSEASDARMLRAR